MSDQNNHKIIITTPSGDDLVFWEPFEKQIQFHESSVTNLLARGSRGSGKSGMLRNDAHMWAMSVPNCNLILIRKTYKQLQQSHLLNISKEMKQLGGYYHATNFVAHYPTGSRLFFSYVGHEADALNLLSAEFLRAYYDELSVIPWEFFLKLSASVRVTGKRGLKASTRSATNPFGESAGDIEKYFVTKDIDPEEDPDYDPAEWDYIQINMEDNPHLDLEQYKKRFAGLPAHLRKAWLDGEFSDEEALFEFKPFRDGRPYHVLKELDLPRVIKNAQIYRAIDWGWHPDPSYCVWIAHLGNRYIAFHEKVWYKTIVPDLAAQIKEEEEKLGIRKIAGSFCDPTLDIHTGAEIRTNKEIFEDHGIPLEASINNRELFASAIHTALAEEVEPGIPRLQIFDGGKYRGCPYLIKALPLMRYNPKKPLALADHKHDHPCVSLAYFLISQASYERRSFTQRIIRPWMKPKKSDSKLWVLGNESVKDRY